MGIPPGCPHSSVWEARFQASSSHPWPHPLASLWLPPPSPLPRGGLCFFSLRFRPLGNPPELGTLQAELAISGLGEGSLNAFMGGTLTGQGREGMKTPAPEAGGCLQEDQVPPNDPPEVPGPFGLENLGAGPSSLGPRPWWLRPQYG